MSYDSLMQTFGEVVGALAMGLLWATVGLRIARLRAWDDRTAVALSVAALALSGGILGSLLAGTPPALVGRLALMQGVAAVVFVWHWRRDLTVQ